jgi:hypothetical protein
MKASSNEMRVLTAAETEMVGGGLSWSKIWSGIKKIAKGVGEVIDGVLH